MCSRSRRRSAFDGGSSSTNSAVSRPTPRSRSPAQRKPGPSPTMISTLPPPRSKHSAGAGSMHDARPHGGEDQPRLLEAADHLDVDAGLGLDAVDDLVAVARGAQRARRRRGPRWRRRLGEQPQAAHGARPRGRRPRGDHALAAHDVAEAQHLLLAGDRLEAAVGVHVGDDEVEGVRSEVEGRDPHLGGSSDTAARAHAAAT